MIKDYTLKILCFIGFAMCFSFGYSQDRTCGMMEHMQEKMKDPEYARKYEQRQKKFREELNKILELGAYSQRGGQITIPVAVHFPDGDESDRLCLEALAQSQVDILNADYTATNTDIAQWFTISDLYPGISNGSANVTFCMAVSNHPDGLDPELIEGNPAVTIGYNYGGGTDVDANWAGYMNFVIRPIGGGVLGFSPLGGNIAAGEAVTLNTFSFGSGAGCPGSGIVPSAPYNLGRTTTHELGHFYNLDHPFNEGFGVCGMGGDGIADTPEVANSTFGCAPPGSVDGCVVGEKALTMNYMDYADDACMYMFTQGQVTVVEAWLAILAAQFKPNVCDPPLPGFYLTANNNPVLSCPTLDTEAVFNLSYTTIVGFSETTSFSASGLPPGATVSFSPTSLSANGSFTMTVGNLDATTEGEYTITVTGTSGSVTETIDVLLKNTCTSIQCMSYDSAENLNIAIPDSPGGITPGILRNVFMNIPNPNVIEKMTVTVDVSHPWISDLVVGIIPPGGTFPNDILELWSRNCGVTGPPGVQNFDIIFDDEGALLPGIDECSNNLTGIFAPAEDLSDLNGTDAQGDWELVIGDFVNGDIGILNNWSIEICVERRLSVKEFEVDTFSIFPNPNKGEFTVNLNTLSNEDVNIGVFDIRGRRIFDNTYANNSDFSEVVRLNNVQSGMYLVTVNYGNKQMTKKIVVD